MVLRNKVQRTRRIIETEKLILKNNPVSVLEVGAGDYSFDYLSSQLNSNIQWHKLDFAPPCDFMIDINAENIHLPLTEKSYDMVIITEVLEHLLWPQSILAELHRVLQDGGKLIGSVPNIVSLSYRIKWLFGGIPSCASSGNMPEKLSLTAYHDEEKIIAGHVIDFNKKKLKQLFTCVSFSKIRFHSVGLYWGKQILSAFLTPVTLSSNLLFEAEK
jgi:SAM-dependent methyltransferase